MDGRRMDGQVDNNCAIDVLYSIAIVHQKLQSVEQRKFEHFSGQE